jgi:hypothetical protein
LEETEAFCSTQLVSESSQSWMMLDGVSMVYFSYCRVDLRLGGLVAVVGLAGLAGGDRGVVDELEQVLSVASNDGELLAVLAHGIELVGEGGLELLAGDVGQLGLGDQGLGLSANKLLLENNNLGGVGLLVLQLGNLVGDLLLAYKT